MTKTTHDSQTPAHDQQVFTAAAFIHRKHKDSDQVFLPKRASTKKFLPGVFELPGGHIDFGEDMVIGLKREIKEEFEVEISVGDPFYVFTYHNPIKGSHSIEVIYFARFITPESQIKLHLDDHSEYRWFNSSQVNQGLGGNKPSDDPEVQAILHGFSLLNGAALNFG